MKKTGSPSVDIIDHKTLVALNKAVVAKRTPSSEGDYRTWLRYHKALVKVLNKFGVAGDAGVENPDFYYSGDWFHEETDGFAIRTASCLNKKLFIALQKVVQRHHPNATLWLVGDRNTPVDKLCFFVTPTIMLAALADESASACQSRLEETGIDLKR
jgi:hypothetical protein